NSWDINKYCTVNFLYYSNYVLLSKDSEYEEAIHESSFLLPDGIGLQVLYRFKFGIELPNLNGTDFLPFILRHIANTNRELAIYGSTERSYQYFKEMLFHEYRIEPYLFINGFEDIDFETISKNSILLVGRGSPLQEKWVFQNMEVIR